MPWTKPYYVTAYGLAVQQGYTGTLDEWLESLHGYVHIKFADSMPTRDSDMKDTSGDWMGIMSGASKDASSHYSDYEWTCIKGSANAAAIAPAYNSGTSYSNGDCCSVGETVYVCTAQSATGTFDPSKWQATTLFQAVKTLGLAGAVAYTAQSKTDTEKARARTNIGALSSADGAVKAANIDSGAVTRNKILDGEVVQGKLGSNAVKRANILDGEVIEGKLATDAVTRDKIKAGEVVAGKLGSLAVATGNIQNGAVTGVKMNLANGDLGPIILTSGVHYFQNTESLPAATLGRICFVKAAE